MGLAFKLMEEAEKTWRKIRCADRIAALLDGVPFKDGYRRRTIRQHNKNSPPDLPMIRTAIHHN